MIEQPTNNPNLEQLSLQLGLAGLGWAAVWAELSNKAEFVAYLEPEQLAMSKGGGHKLVFCVRTLLEENPNFIAIKLDVENAQNSISRAKCIEELEQIPELQHLAWHAATTLAPYTALHSGGERWGEAQEGQCQGDPEATPYYCI